jgi:hypothetical protein
MVLLQLRCAVEQDISGSEALELAGVLTTIRVLLSLYAITRISV